MRMIKNVNLTLNCPAFFEVSIIFDMPALSDEMLLEISSFVLKTPFQNIEFVEKSQSVAKGYKSNNILPARNKGHNGYRIQNNFHMINTKWPAIFISSSSSTV